MIIDQIERLSNYKALLPSVDNALEKVKELTEWEEGVRYPFEGGFVFFQKGVTKPLAEAQFETHRNYIDVQLVLEGAEYVALDQASQLQVVIPYVEERDIEKYQGPTEHYMKISQGMGYVCFPWDAHQAVFHVDEPEQFVKAVIKLAIEKE